jgi:hypothetical protein
MILGAVLRSPGIYLTAEENPRKPQLGDRLMKGLCEMFFMYLKNSSGLNRLSTVSDFLILNYSKSDWNQRFLILHHV